MLGIIFRIIFKFLSTILLIAAIFAVLVNWPVKSKNENMTFGISFSHVYARDIGLDWKETYLAILDELKPPKVRLGAYWTEIEKSEGLYDFSDLLWQVKEAEERGVKVVVAFGVKAPRWPECFIPPAYKDDKSKREEALLKFEEALVSTLKGYENIEIWQVENEPFLPFFGDCPEGAVDGALVDKEKALVKSIDPSRPIMVTDSGELSLWYQAASRADVFGTTLYRTIYKEPYGYFTYPISPNFFRMKALFVKLFANQNDVIISELQAEPWGPKWIGDMSVEEQYKSMNPERFLETVDYAKRTNFKEAYLWGAEWWYWLRENQEKTEMWDAAAKVIGKEEQ